MNRAAISRADLLMAHVRLAAQATLPAGLLGFERKPLPETEEPEISLPKVGTEPGTAAPVKTGAAQHQKEPLPFLFLTGYKHFSEESSAPSPDVQPLTDSDLAVPSSGAEPYTPLAPWRRLAPFLRRRLGRLIPSRRLDYPRLFRQMASGLPWSALPYRQRICWAPSACLIWDTGPEMEPFQPDVLRLISRLKRERGRYGLNIFQERIPPHRLLHLPAQTPVVALSTLGQMPGDARLEQRWQSLACWLVDAGHPLTALCPVPRRRWQPASTASWPTAVWDRLTRLPLRLPPPRHSAAECLAFPMAAPAAELVLDLLAPATLVTPGLLRQVRLLLGPGADVGTESEAWHHPDTTGAESLRYFCFREGPEYDERMARHAALANAPSHAGLAAKAQELIRQHHQRFCSLPVALEASLRMTLASPQDTSRIEALRASLQQAVQRLRELAVTPDSQQGRRSGLPQWFCGFVETRLPSVMRAMPDIAPVIASGLALARHFLRQLDQAWPDRLDVRSAVAELRQLPGQKRHPRQSVEVVLTPPGLRFVEERNRAADWLVHELRYRELWLHVLPGGGQAESMPLEVPFHLPLHPQSPSFSLLTDETQLDLEWRTRPAWATRMWYDREGLRASVRISGQDYLFGWTLGGEDLWPVLGGGPLQEEGRWKLLQSPPPWAETLEIDSFGLRAQFSIANVLFTLRWIPPGWFTMGSPKGEPGRWEIEGPQHEVTISQGYWLAETPVTQAQWRAVVQAAWTRPGLWKKVLGEWSLITEPSVIKGDDRPVEHVNWQQSRDFCRLLDALLPEGPGFGLPTEARWEYACRAGTKNAFNDDSACTLPEGFDPAVDRLGWFRDNSGGLTHPVKKKVPNEWGLYDMHGNVWEWCADAWYDYTLGPQTNPIHVGNDKALHVLRGGGWGAQARYCRSASRYRDDPNQAWNYRGLRLAAGQHELQAVEKPDNVQLNAPAGSHLPKTVPTNSPRPRKGSRPRMLPAGSQRLGVSRGTSQSLEFYELSADRTILARRVVLGGALSVKAMETRTKTLLRMFADGDLNSLFQDSRTHIYLNPPQSLGFAGPAVGLDMPIYSGHISSPTLRSIVFYVYREDDVLLEVWRISRDDFKLLAKLIDRARGLEPQMMVALSALKPLPRS